MNITKVTRVAACPGNKFRSLFSVEATVDGARFEFTSFRGQAFEVYDHPKSYKGLPRYVGILPADTASKLYGLVARFDRAAYQARYGAMAGVAS